MDILQHDGVLSLVVEVVVTELHTVVSTIEVCHVLRIVILDVQVIHINSVDARVVDKLTRYGEGEGYRQLIVNSDTRLPHHRHLETARHTRHILVGHMVLVGLGNLEVIP